MFSPCLAVVATKNYHFTFTITYRRTVRNFDYYRPAASFTNKAPVTTTLKLKTYNWQAANYNMKRATAIKKVTSCKEMAGATSHACQSGTHSVSKRLIPSIASAGLRLLEALVHSEKRGPLKSSKGSGGAL